MLLWYGFFLGLGLESLLLQLVQVSSGHTCMQRYVRVWFVVWLFFFFSFWGYLAYFVDRKYKASSGHSLKSQ